MHVMTGGAHIVNPAQQAIRDEGHKHEDHADHKDDHCVHVRGREGRLEAPHSRIHHCRNGNNEGHGCRDRPPSQHAKSVVSTV